MGSRTERRSSELNNTEFFIQEIWGDKRCSFCNASPVVIEGRASLPESKVNLTDPIGVLAGKYGSPLRFKEKLTTELYYTVEVKFACHACKKGMEQGFAHKYGDSAYVIFDRGATDKLIVSG